MNSLFRQGWIRSLVFYCKKEGINARNNNSNMRILIYDKCKTKMNNEFLDVLKNLDERIIREGI